MNITITLIGQMVAFILLIWFVHKMLWGPMSKMLADRQKKIAEGLAAADKGKHEMELAEKRAKDLLKDAKTQAVEIITLAQKRASEIEEEGKSKARAEAERIQVAAQAEVERGINQAKEQLRAHVSSIALSGAGKILKKEIDAKTHNALLAELAAQV
jgi:F-type H+-transporting ATPase subunit b